MAFLPRPTNVRLQSVTQNSATLTWDAVQGAHWYEVRVNYRGPWTRLSSSARSYDFTGLTPNTRYRLNVRAGRGSVVSGFLAFVDFQTLQTVIPSSSSSLRVRYIVIKTDDSEMDISRQVKNARVKVGVDYEQGWRPYSKSQGEVNLNDWREEYQDTSDWDLLNIYAGDVLVFATSIMNTARYGEYGRLRVFVELIATANMPLRYVRRSVGLNDVLLGSYLGTTGIPLTRLRNVSMPTMWVAAGTGYDDEVDIEPGVYYSVNHRFDDGGSRLVEDLCTFGTMFAFECNRIDAIRMYPVQAMQNDNRNADARGAVGSNDLVRREDFKIGTDEWLYDGQRYNTNSGVVGQKTIKDYDPDSSTLRRGRVTFFGQKLHHQTYDVLGGDREDFVGWNSLSASGFITDEYGRGFTPEVHGESDGRVTVYLNKWSPVFKGHIFVHRLRITVSYFVRKSNNFKTKDFVADGADGNMTLQTSGLPIPRGNANATATEAAIQSKLNFLDGYDPRVIRVTRLLEQNGVLSPLLLECGDVVDIRKGEAADRCLLTGIEFKHEGLKPIQLRWAAISLKPIPQSAPGTDPNAIFFQGTEVHFEGETVDG